MPDIRVYLPLELYLKFIQEKHKSKLIQELLLEYYDKGENKQKENRKKKKNKEVIKSQKREEKELGHSKRNIKTPTFTYSNVRGI